MVPTWFLYVSGFSLILLGIMQIQARPREKNANLYERFVNVGRCGSKDENGGDTIVGVQPELRDQLAANGQGRFGVGIHVSVGIDKTRHDRLSGYIDTDRSGRDLHGGPRADGCHTSVTDDERSLLERRASSAIDQPRAREDDSAGGRCLRKRRLEEEPCQNE